MNDIKSIATTDLAEGLYVVAKTLEKVLDPRGLLILMEASDRLISQKAELISCYRKLSERDLIECKDIDHGDEIKKTIKND